MDMSFREKSIWISLISTLLIFGDYFLNIVSLSSMPAEVSKAAALGLSLRALLLIIVVEILLQGLLAISNRKEAAQGSDERDKLFEYKANNFGYAVLVIGVFITLGRIVFLEFNTEVIQQSTLINIPLLTAHILLFSFIFSEVVRFSAQLYYYRSSH
ncbi:hypothetical protein [uncultured Paraglaciecola sp.]|uniref:hypothetical protein n=1 Tax=uncultured Paraglaciecola sp. TaxID=1765024 RepID=UPI0030D9BB8A|tara:strand:+ start:146778 stop:147248 length:471 start_codon:yes stop_codon:yes gene_type:complete